MEEQLGVWIPLEGINAYECGCKANFSNGRLVGYPLLCDKHKALAIAMARKM